MVVSASSSEKKAVKIYGVSLPKGLYKRSKVTFLTLIKAVPEECFIVFKNAVKDHHEHLYYART
jgi:hypothetical protein